MLRVLGKMLGYYSNNKLLDKHSPNWVSYVLLWSDGEDLRIREAGQEKCECWMSASLITQVETNTWWRFHVRTTDRHLIAAATYHAAWKCAVQSRRSERRKRQAVMEIDDSVICEAQWLIAGNLSMIELEIDGAGVHRLQLLVTRMRKWRPSIISWSHQLQFSGLSIEPRHVKPKDQWRSGFSKFCPHVMNGYTKPTWNVY